MNLHIRWAIRRDMPEIIDIARDRIVGFMVYELQPKRLSVLNFAVHPEERRRGVGSAMAYKLTTKLSPQRRTHITLAVRDSNLDAHLFWRSCGFQAVDVLRDYYDDTSDDAYLFRFDCREGVEA